MCIKEALHPVRLNTDKLQPNTEIWKHNIHYGSNIHVRFHTTKVLERRCIENRNKLLNKLSNQSM
jgi:hypothetical protein